MVRRCANGHYYDGNRFPNCPYCNAEDVTENSNAAYPAGGVGKMFSDVTFDGNNMNPVNSAQAAGYKTGPDYFEDDDATRPTPPQFAVQQPVHSPVQSEEQAPVQDAQEFNEAPPAVTTTIPDEAPADFTAPEENTPSFEENQPSMNETTSLEFNTQSQSVPEAPEAPAVSPSEFNAQTPVVLEEYGDLINNTVNNPIQIDDDPTVSIYGSRMKSEPTVGWLIGLSAPYLGECFELRAGKNFIGSGPDMDIVLAADNKVSRYRHAVVLYEPKARIFLAQAGDSRELFYINDEAVLNNQPLEAYDKLTVGETKLMFFPLCSSEFSWDDVQEEN